MRKNHIIYILLLFSFGRIIQCSNSNKQIVENDVENHPLIDSFNSLSRDQQVKTCGSCHQMEYENEMKGPHANAFKRLHEHVNSDWSKNPEYAEYLKTTYVLDSTHLCKTCHALPNMYETMLVIPNNNKDSLKKYIEDIHVPERSRSGKIDELLTGVDCLTCHFDGKNVVTNFGFKPEVGKNSPPYCSPKGSNLFSSNNNCITCHIEEVKKIVQLPNIKQNETNCLNCHQEYNKVGQSTHYIYWQNDPIDKMKPERLILFEDISAIYDLAHKRVVVKWENTRLPHPLTLCTETMASFIVTDSRNTVYGKGEIRLNRQLEHVNVLSPFWTNGPVPGENGYSIPLDGSLLFDTIAIDAPKGVSLQLKVVGGHKEQYWLHDSTQVVSYKRTIKL